jgi:uncharacterized membrane protein
MAGMLNIGTDYKNRAISGFVRQSAQQSEIDRANDQLDAAEKAQSASMGSQGAAAGGTLGFMVGGIPGMVAGAGLGFLFSRLF